MTQFLHITARCVFTHPVFLRDEQRRSKVEGRPKLPEAKRIAKKECVSSGFFLQKDVFFPRVYLKKASKPPVNDSCIPKG